MEYHFGSGNLFGLVAAGGVNVPRKFGALQDLSVDFSFTMKELYGQLQFPLVVARGQGKIAGKAKYASLNGGMVNDLFFGGSNATGQDLHVIGEAAVVPTTPFQITVANAATFKEDLGVTNGTTGVPLLRVASAPATGQYSASGVGIYLFAAADVGVAVLIDYAYTATTGNKTTISNLLSGTTPTFGISIPMKFNAKQFYLRLNAVTSSKLTIATKIEDFVVPEFDFMAFADASNTIGTFSLQE
jgi:hypothetical protein